jgi:hypothetical protein
LLNATLARLPPALVHSRCAWNVTLRGRATVKLDEPNALLLLHIRQDIKLIAILLGGVILMLGIVGPIVEGTGPIDGRNTVASSHSNLREMVLCEGIRFE